MKLDEGYRGCGRRSAMETVQRRRLEAARCVRLNFPNQSSFQVRVTEISKCDGEDDLQEVMTGVR